MKILTPSSGAAAVVCGLLVVLAFSLSSAHAQVSTVALLLQETPAGAGILAPQIGIHRFAPGSQIVLTAVPRPGYEFIYWLGDVAEPTASTTVAYLDQPKIIIAVFRKISEHTHPIVVGGGGTQAGSFLTNSPGLSPAPGVVSTPVTINSVTYSTGGGFIAGTREAGPSPIPPSPPIPPEPPQPPPVPEPATIVLLGLGASALLAKRPRR